MATDEGLISDIEAAIISKIESLQVDSEDIFNEVDHWKYQINTLKNWDNKYPFAYTRYAGCPSISPQGDAELLQSLRFEIVIGTKNKTEGGSRIGTGTDAGDRELGCSQIRDIVVNALHDQSLTTTKGTDNLIEYIGDEVHVDLPEYYALILKINVDCLGV